MEATFSRSRSRSRSPTPNTILHSSQEGEVEAESRIYEDDDDNNNNQSSIRSYSQDSHVEPLLKRSKPCKVDRLSDLPNSMITHILSFLPVHDAVLTDLLSKRWHNAWVSSPSLLFTDNNFNCYHKFISTALMLHKGPIIKKLSLSEIQYVDPQLNLWVQSAVIKRVEELDIEIDRFIVHIYSLPRCLLLCDTLREFSLNVGNIDFNSAVCWKSLGKLTLKSIENLKDDMIRKILDGSLILEWLSLIDCEGFSHINVRSGSKLRNLVIKSCITSTYVDEEDEYENEDNGGVDWLEVSGPSITSLEISGYMGEKHCRIKDVSSLVQVSLRFWMSSLDLDYENDDEGSSDEASRLKLQKRQWMLLDLLRKVNHVENLFMGTWCTQVLSICKFKMMPTTVLLKCKSLELERLNERSLPGIARLLQSSPYLERLTIYMDSYQSRQVEHLNEFSDFDGKNYWKAQEQSLYILSMHRLKVVRFIGFETNDTLMVEFAEFMLEQAKMLEKLEFKPKEIAYYPRSRRSDFRQSCLFLVIQKLLSYPRSSKHARILLS